MAFRQASIYTKKLAEILQIDESELSNAIKQSLSGGFARVWEVSNEGNYSSVKLTTRRKVPNTENEYETDFMEGFVRFIGSAHKKIQEVDIPDGGLAIQITQCQVESRYVKEKKSVYRNFAVFAFNVVDDSDASKPAKKSKVKPKTKARNTPSEDVSMDDDLPF